MESDRKITIEVHLKPNAKSNEIKCFKDGILYVKVAAPPYKGAANKALIKLLAKTLSIPKSSFDIAHGYTNRSKVIDIQGLTAEELKDKLSQALDNEGTLDI